MTELERPLSGVTVAELLGLLDLQARDSSGEVLEGEHTEMSRRVDHVFGGLVAAQTVVAAGRTVTDDERPINSLHMSFLRAGDHRVPLVYEVERVRDGGAVSHRQVSVRQHDRVIATGVCSFARAQRGPEHTTSAPVVPAAEELARDIESVVDPTRAHPAALVTDVVELRTVPGEPDRLRQWWRADGDLPDDPLLHAAVLTYASDLRILQPALRPHGLSLLDGQTRTAQPATLSHTVWFHESVRCDDWLLLDAGSGWAGHGRAMAHGRVFDRDSRLVAELAQEAVIRF